jgi:hypothetical protein
MISHVLASGLISMLGLIAAPVVAVGIGRLAYRGQLGRVFPGVIVGLAAGQGVLFTANILANWVLP